MFKVDLSAPQDSSFEASASDFGLSNTKFSNIRVALRAEQSGEGMRVLLDVHAEVRLACDRTLREFTAPVSNAHKILLLRPGQETAEDDMTEPVELDHGQRIYDLTDVIRDLLLLAIPVRKVAPDAENLPIQTVFGAPVPDADPRWSALLAMRGELSQ